MGAMLLRVNLSNGKTGKEPIAEGAAGGHVAPLEEMLDDYYQYRGWNHEGRPTPQKLAELGLA